MIAIEELVVELGGRRVVDGASLEIAPGEALGLVGESGSGKTSLALSILDLLPRGAARGRLRVDGREVVDRRALRGRAVGMVFQEPLVALNPVMRLRDQLAEALDDEPEVGRLERAFEEVGLSADRLDDYPHALSGGMRQRALIAMALLSSPRLLVADEPTTALDLTVQAQILGLLARLQRVRGMSMLLVSHDLAVIAASCARVAVMYAGRIVEAGPVDDVIASPLHPYTAALIASRPRGRGAALSPISGKTPERLPSGCRFRDRCPSATSACASEPPRVERSPPHVAWCAHPLPPRPER